MGGVFWGSRDVEDVIAAGVATQLFPVGAPASGMTDTTTWPPAAAGKVRRPTHGKLHRLVVTPDGTNSGVLELWDVAGKDRGASNNVNSGGDTITDTYLDANGTLIQKLLVDGTGDAGVIEDVQGVPFSKGLAVRFVGSAGLVSIAATVEGGFMVSEHPAG